MPRVADSQKGKRNQKGKNEAITFHRSHWQVNMAQYISFTVYIYFKYIFLNCVIIRKASIHLPYIH